MDELYTLDLSVDDLDFLTWEQLSSPSVASKLVELSSDPLYDFEPGKAREFYEKLEKIYNQHSDDLKSMPEIYNRYTSVLAGLMFKAIAALPGNSKTNVLKTNLVYSLRQGIDIKSYVKKYLDLFETPIGPDAEERQKFIYALLNNEDRLGTKTLALKTENNVPPTIKNWLKDFSSYLPMNFSGGKFEQVSYLSRNQNVAQLSKQDKEILSKIIELYVWLKHPVALPSRINPPAVPRPVVPIAPKFVPKAPLPPSKPSPTALGLGKPAFTPKHGLSIEQLKHEVYPARSPMRDASASRQGGITSNGGATTAKPVPKPVSLGRDPEIIPDQGPGQGSGLREEIQREIDTPELPSPLAAAAAVKTSLKTLDDIKMVEDMKKVEVGHLRQGELRAQIGLIRNKLSYLASVNKLLPYHVVTAFEQSPLFKTYLDVGSRNIVREKTGQPPSYEPLSQGEFEAVADLRKEIERM